MEMIDVTLLSSAILLGIILKLPFVNIPLDRDYGIYGYHARFWLEGKKQPYRDTIENHPPGRWLWYAALMKWRPVSRSLFRYSNLTFTVMTNLVIYFIANSLFGNIIALYAVFGFAFLSSLPALAWPQSSDEIQQIFFTSLAIWLTLLGEQFGIVFYLLAGLAGFCTLAFKQSAYFNTLPVLLLFVILTKFQVIPVLLVIIGLLTGLFSMWVFFRQQGIVRFHFAYLFALNVKAILSYSRVLRYHTKKIEADQKGATDLVSVNITKSQELDFIYSKNDHRTWLKNLGGTFIRQSALFLLVVPFSLPWLSIIGLDGRDILLIWLWLGAGLAAVLANRHLMPYHLLPLSMPLSILFGVGLANLVRVSNSYVGVVGVGLIIATLVAVALLICRKKIGDMISAEKKGRGHCFSINNDWEFNITGEGVGKYLATQLTSDDQIYVWGDEYEIYLWSGASSPTYKLFCPRPQISFTDDPAGAERELLQQLVLNPPRNIVITALTEGFTEFENFVNTNYVLDCKMFGEIEIYLHKKLQEEKQVVTQIVQEPLVSIIMLTWNALDYTRQCIDSIRANTNHHHEIIFVDNASTDGTQEYLEQLVAENSNYRLIANSKNRGFAAGNNQGMALTQGDYLLLLNNDVLVPEGWLERLVRCAEMDSSIGLVGPLTNRISGLQMIENITYSDPADSFEYARQITQAHQGKYTPRRRLAGFALLISRALYERIGGLDERFGSGNYEDDDYCLRATAAGFKIMVAEDVFIHHFGSVSFESNDVDYNQAMAKNRSLFRDKWPQIDLDWLMERDITLVELNDQIAERAQVALEKQKYTEAIELYQNILKTNPVDDRALYGMGLAYYMQSDNQKALEIFQRITNQIPEFSAVHANIGLIHAQSGDISQAVTSLNRAVELDPHNLDAQVQLAEILLLNDQVDSGAQVLKLVLEADPQHIGALNRMGILMLEINRKEKAQRYFEIARQLDPNNEMAERHLTKINEL